MKISANRRAERSIAKALKGNRHAKPTENCELITANWVLET
jgi:hypothetical protein